MTLFTTMASLMASIVQPTKPLYTTVVYPIQGKAAVLHDGLNIRSKRTWYQYPESLTGEEEKSTYPFDLYIDDNAVWVEPVMQPAEQLHEADGRRLVKPANGLPTMDGCLDAMGNAYGMDSMSESLWFDHGGAFAD